VTPPFPPGPSRFVATPDGTPIALFETGLGAGASDLPSLVLVHGTTADHTTFRAIAPELGLRRHLVAMDRRGRGASGDGPGYAIGREYEDLAAVAASLRTLTGRSVDVLGHSFGGRVGLGAALQTDAIRRLVVYEGAPSAPGHPYRPSGLEARVRERLEAADNGGALEAFFREIVGMDDAAVGAYRANPVWPARAAAAPTILRELEAEASPEASLDALGAVDQPVLLVLGSASRSPFPIATEALAKRLSSVEVAVIDGAAHAAHHTHVPELVAAIHGFLDA
jgi:pimeloyl-ACP methyl ester carboxylesterase